MTTVRHLTQAELLAEAKERFGENPVAYAFLCPNCKDVASIGDFIAAGADPGRAGQECIGRSLGACKATPDNERGCDWAAYGLFHGPWFVLLPAEGDRPEREVPSFALAEALGGAA